MKQTTKTLTLGILFFFAFSMQLSAQKCKYDYDKKDPFTGEMSKGNTFKIDNNNWIMGFNKIGDIYYARLELYCTGNVREFIQKGDPINFKLSNGEVVTIFAQDEVIPVAEAIPGAGVRSIYTGKYSIDSVSLQKIAENPPTFVRMNIESKVYEKEISAKDGKKIVAAAVCILQ
jgi:hypothetical protein